MPETLQQIAPSNGLTESDLTELLRSFNDATEKLHTTHETLRSEVIRLEEELREARDQLRRAKQLAALGEMGAGIAHEIRNPLGSIKLYASVLSKDLADQPPQQELATKIARAVTGLDAIVGDMLTFARELRVQHEVVIASELFAGAVDACADLWATHGITIHLPSETDQIRGIGDSGLLHQALVNVIRNAAQAIASAHGPAPVGGESGRDIHLRAEMRHTLDADGDSRDMMVLVVCDTGSGVPADAMERVFNPFFTTRHTGTGLGLAIVHRIVDAHGGRVVIRNNEGGACAGATVEILLPADGMASKVEEVGA